MILNCIAQTCVDLNQISLRHRRYTGRYLAQNDLAVVIIAAIIAFWL
jgi:hypothetical protein